MKIINVAGHEYINIPSAKIFGELPKYLQTPFTIDWITLHWTAGAKDRAEENYHILVGSDYILCSLEIVTRYHHHTWQRNKGNLGIGIMGAFGAQQHNNNFGSHPIDAGQIEMSAKVFATLKDFYNLPWSKLVDHAYWSDLDKYEPKHAKWDCRLIMPSGANMYQEIHGKAKWYFEKYLKDN